MNAQQTFNLRYIVGGKHVFDTLKEAAEYADRVWRRRGVMLAIEATR